MDDQQRADEWTPSEGSGVLWPQKERRTPRSPVLTGVATLHGAQWEIACWERENRSGSRFYGVAFRPRRPR